MIIDGDNSLSQSTEAIVVYGILMVPIGWKYALWMWAYALGWFVVDNAAKMLAYRLVRSQNGV